MNPESTPTDLKAAITMMHVLSLRRPLPVFLFLFIACAGIAYSHGPTICLGQVSTSPTSATLDLRVGVGLVHKIVDPDDSAFISNTEWTNAQPALREFFTTGIVMKKDDGTSVPWKLVEINRPNTVEVQGLAVFDFSAMAGQKGHLQLPLLRNLQGVPPSNISVWSGANMVQYPSLLFYGRDLVIEPK